MASDTYRSDPERAAQLAVYLALYARDNGGDASPTRIGTLVAEMQKAARSAKRVAVYACNGPATPGGMSAGWYRALQEAFEATAARNEKRQEKAQALLNAGLRHMGQHGAANSVPTIELGGDPRGPCAVLHIPGQRGDGWGDGFAIY